MLVYRFISLNPHSNSIAISTTIIVPFYRWENWGWEKLECCSRCQGCRARATGSSPHLTSNPGLTSTLLSSASSWGRGRRLVQFWIPVSGTGKGESPLWQQWVGCLPPANPRGPLQPWFLSRPTQVGCDWSAVASASLVHRPDLQRGNAALLQGTRQRRLLSDTCSVSPQGLSSAVMNSVWAGSLSLLRTCRGSDRANPGMAWGSSLQLPSFLQPRWTPPCPHLSPSCHQMKHTHAQERQGVGRPWR